MWKDACKRDIGLKAEDVLDRTKVRTEIENHSGNPRRRKNPKKKRNTPICRQLSISCTHKTTNTLVSE